MNSDIVTGEPVHSNLVESTKAPQVIMADRNLASAGEARADGSGKQPTPVRAAGDGALATPVWRVLAIVLVAVAILHFARPVVLPIALACVGGMTLRPLVRRMSGWGIFPAFSTAVVMGLLLAVVGFGFFELGRPAATWINRAPELMTRLRQRVQSISPYFARLNRAAAAVNNLGATEEEKQAEQRIAPTVEVKDGRGPGLILNWTGTLLVGAGETLVLLYLLLASGDLFLQKLVRVMPTLRDKVRAVEITHEIQQSISNYLMTVSLINIGMGLLVSTGCYFMGVPNAPLWGLLVAVLNYVPYFGPVAGVTLLTAVGLLSFDTLGPALLPPAWYLLLHLLEANLITPVLLGRRFTLNPVVVFVSLIFWNWLWGVPGALLSIPILVSLKVLCDRVPALSSVSELLSR